MERARGPGGVPLLGRASEVVRCESEVVRCGKCTRPLDPDTPEGVFICSRCQPPKDSSSGHGSRGGGKDGKGGGKSKGGWKGGDSGKDSGKGKGKGGWKGGEAPSDEFRRVGGILVVLMDSCE